ncbi:hypothetical protein HYX09_03470, partial [Candidatus Woesearchaeota archaeon]|nr:hypothetical protein [Candidatus Woesearchaeota archaeon]
VNLYNYLSLNHLISAGGDDADKVNGDVVLALADGNEKFLEIGKADMENPDKGEAIFKDDNDVLGRRWNWRQAEKTKITVQSRNINLQIEGVSPITKKEIMEASEELITFLKKFFNTKPSLYFLDKESAFAEIR